MFMLYSVFLGLAIALLAGGRVTRLGQVPIRWGGLAIAGLAIQLVLFSDPVTAVIGDAGPPIYVASTAAVLAVVIRNLRLVGLPIVAIGAASNLIAILANGGYMPASPDALAGASFTIGTGYSNSVEGGSVALAPLTDIFAMPAWLPATNVFSIGDVLIGIGIVIAIVAATRNPRFDPPPTQASVPHARPS